MENNGENRGPLTSLPVNRLNGDRLQRRRSCQKVTLPLKKELDFEIFKNKPITKERSFVKNSFSSR